jgi:acyl dehydratase
MVRIGPQLRGYAFTPWQWSWDADDVMLYALGVGASPPRDLPLIYEGAGPVVLPTFATVSTGKAFLPMVEELGIDLGSILHGEQSITLHRPLGPRGAATVYRRVSDVWDKGSSAVLVIDERVEDDGLGWTSRSSWVVTGAGGFGGERGPSAGTVPSPPARDPDVVSVTTVRPEQSALYRLSGDRNPVHIDPDLARSVGFDGVFLHGLCTFGMVGLALLMELCDGHAEEILELSARFVASVRPGDDLEIRLWRSAGQACMEASVDGRTVLAGGRATLRDREDVVNASGRTARH